MAHRVPITIHVESFEGPLDLLLYLIQSHELDISKVSIGKITDQYLAYVTLLQELNFDAASEFLVMAATLLHWKSKALLPQENKAGDGTASDEPEALTQEELVRQLLEHQRFLAAGETLGELPLLGQDVFSRANAKPPVEKVWREMNLTDLSMAYQDMIIQSRKRTQILKKETVSLTDKILEFGQTLPLHQWVDMKTLMPEFPARPEIVVTFLAGLELSRLKKMRMHQEGAYQTVYLELIDDLKNFDTQLASGFDAIERSLAAQKEAPPSPVAHELAPGA
ncbi:MAG: segregation and condensation protein A [Bdellovibrionia bacterium]